jgi:general secretion pathway protein G
MNHSHFRPNRGFTLIEVLLVLVILVILASLAATNIGAMRSKANISAAKAQIGAFKTPLDAYQLDIGMYPSTNQGLQALRTPPADIPNPQAWSGPYLDREIPMDPWGRQYQYISPGRYNQDYDIWSLGPGGSEQTAIGNWSLGQ